MDRKKYGIERYRDFFKISISKTSKLNTINTLQTRKKCYMPKKADAFKNSKMIATTLKIITK